jgi:hypothetical protein
MMVDRHKTAPKAVRMPDGLLAWYEQHAAATGRPVNAALVAALTEYRTQHEGGSTTVAAAPRQGTTTAPAPAPVAAVQHQPQRAGKNCPHPRARINKGLCGACGTYVGIPAAGGKR